MDTSKTENIYGISLYKNTVLSAVAIGLIFPLSAWLIDFMASNTQVSLSGILKLHQNNSVHWIIDLMPLLSGLIAYFFSVLNKKQNLLYKNKLKQKEDDISKNAALAKKIGEGNYDVDINIKDDNDILGKSLSLMRDNLLANNKKESEQNWIAEGKSIISNLLRIHDNVDKLSYEVLVQLIKYINAIQGALYIYNEEKQTLVNLVSYAFSRKKYINQEFKIGKGLIGQCAYEMDIIYRTEVPDDYITITSGILGEKKPSSIIIIPLITDEKLQGVIEFASIEEKIPELTILFLKELGEIIARTIFNLNINQKTKKLLQESQQMTEELQENEEELRQNAEEMRAAQEELQKSNEKLESQFLEIENAQVRLHSLLENASEIISIYDKSLKLTYISPSVYTILGFTQEEMMKGMDRERLTRKGNAKLQEMFTTLFDDPGGSGTIQYTYMKKNGEKTFLEVTGRNMLRDPAINGIIINTQDITERLRAEKEERVKSKMQSLSENSLDMIIRLGTDGRFYYCNPVVEDYIGFHPTEMINNTLDSIALPEVLNSYFKETSQQIKSKLGKVLGEVTIPVMLGEKVSNRIMRIDAIPELNENELESILFVGHDITEAKRIELEIQQKNKKIEDSINYAERIQSSILPGIEMIRKFLPKSFIFYEPRDIVSGDFPWFFRKDGQIYIAVVDCTGHGVPGALLSFIGYFILNHIVDSERELNPGEICDELHIGVRKTLKQDTADANAPDGMDIAFCKINLKNNEVQYAGAHRALYLLRKGELTEYKGNRKAIGGISHKNKPEDNFQNYAINFKTEDKIFFFSDGLPDQLGGPENKKYTAKRIREILVNNPDLSMDQYDDYFTNDYKEWIGNNKQIDDVLLIGIEF